MQQPTESPSFFVNYLHLVTFANQYDQATEITEDTEQGKMQIAKLSMQNKNAAPVSKRLFCILQLTFFASSSVISVTSVANS